MARVFGLSVLIKAENFLPLKRLVQVLTIGSLSITPNCRPQSLSHSRTGSLTNSLHCRRAGSSDLFQTLCKEVKVLIISVKCLFSKQKRKPTWYDDQLHDTIDSIFVETIIHNRQNLKEITVKTRSKARKK